MHLLAKRTVDLLIFPFGVRSIRTLDYPYASTPAPAPGTHSCISSRAPTNAHRNFHAPRIFKKVNAFRPPFSESSPVEREGNAGQDQNSGAFSELSESFWYPLLGNNTTRRFLAAVPTRSNARISMMPLQITPSLYRWLITQWRSRWER